MDGWMDVFHKITRLLLSVWVLHSWFIYCLNDRWLHQWSHALKNKQKNAALILMQDSVKGEKTTHLMSIWVANSQSSPKVILHKSHKLQEWKCLMSHCKRYSIKKLLSNCHANKINQDAFMLVLQIEILE